MKNFNFFVLFSILLMFTDTLNAQSKSIIISLYRPNAIKRLDYSKDFSFSIKIYIAKEISRKIILPYCLDWSYDIKEYDSTQNDAIWTVEKLQNNKYSSNGVRTEINDHGWPCVDSLGNEKFDTLSKNKPVFCKKNLDGYYNFNPGKFRVRVMFIFNKSMIGKKEEIFSNWVYFTVE